MGGVSQKYYKFVIAFGQAGCALDIRKINEPVNQLTDLFLLQKKSQFNSSAFQSFETLV